MIFKITSRICFRSPLVYLKLEFDMLKITFGWLPEKYWNSLQ
jgi:hypothetical protein